MSYEVQIQLLRALQERRIKPVGGLREIPVDVRLICATNEDLEAAIARGSFRADLYHRIDEFVLHMPDLAERREDIMLYADFFWTRPTASSTNTWWVSIRRLKNCSWPATGPEICGN